MKEAANYYENYYKKGRLFTAFTAGLVYMSFILSSDFPPFLLAETAALVGGVYFSTYSYDLFKDKENEAQKRQETLNLIEEETTCRAKLA